MMAQNSIAVIGMAGRFPGANDLEEFWSNLENGKVARRQYSDDELLREGIAPKTLTDANYIKVGYPIDNVDMFDAEFFKMSPREAAITDPQQRLFLECVWTALETAGYDPTHYQGDIGLYAGSKMNSYLLNNLQGPGANGQQRFDSFELLLGNDKDYLTSRVSYKLNLKGPSVVIQTACSSSLVAVHYACEALIDGDCDMAVAGGISVRVPVYGGYHFQKGALLSDDGFCRAYSDAAGGTVEGNGFGVVVLKPLEDAIKDGDNILAVIRGSAVNNDGSEKIGFTAPSGDGQMKVVSEALQVAGISPQDISLVEGHGTGTVLGDPVEVTALSRVYRRYTDKIGYCALGSVKANIGHLDTAAGIASFIKVILALQHRKIAPAANYGRHNPEIGLEHSPFFIPCSAQEWSSAGPRIAAVTSLGIGGTNCHVIVEEAPTLAATQATNLDWHVLALSARSPAALHDMARNLARHLQQNKDLVLADVAWTLLEGRKRFAYRRAVLCRDLDEALIGLLADAGADGTHPPIHDQTSSSFHRLRTLAQRWVTGAEIEAEALYGGEKRRRLPLPTYPFEYQRYWVEPARTGNESSNHEGDASVKAVHVQPPPEQTTREQANHVHYAVPSWTRMPVFRIELERQLANANVLVVQDRFGHGQHLVRRLQKHGCATVVQISRGTAFRRINAQEYMLDIADPHDYQLCFDELAAANSAPRYILYCSEPAPSASASAVTHDLTEFWEFMILVQGIGRSRPFHDLNIAIVTQETQDIFGAGALQPDKGILESFVKSVPLEYPQIKIKLLDIDRLSLEPGNDRWLDLVLDDLVAPTSSVIAYRNATRWKKDVKAVSLERQASGLETIENGCTYLLTGGLGDIALEVCAYLAARGPCKLILLVKNDAHLLPVQVHGRMEKVFGELRKIELRIHKEMVSRGTQEYEEFTRVLKSLCTAYVIEHIKSRNEELKAGREYDVEEIVSRITKKERFRKYVRFLLHTLGQAGVVRHNAGKLTFTEDLHGGESADVIRTRLVDAYPQYIGMIDLLSHCVKNYGRVFSGEIEPAEVLYPDGTGKLLDEAHQNTAQHSSYRQYCQLLLEFIVLYRKKKSTGAIRVLEIGGGYGNLTKVLLPVLAGYDVHYCFTDLSKSFVRQAQAMARSHGYESVQFATLDITKDVEAQGFARNSFDLVVGLDVVHATPDIEHTLRNLWSLLAEGGTLSLVETTRDSTWLSMVMGLTDGWWAFHDDRTASPLLDRAAWQRKLEQVKLGPCAIFPESVTPEGADCSLILLAKENSDATQPAAKHEKLQKLRGLGAEVVVVKADVTNRQELAAALESLSPQRHQIDGIIHTAGIVDGKLFQSRTREDIEEVMAPKVLGVQNLYREFGARPLSMWVNCSSIVAVNGAVGQLAHCAANQYLDDFTAYLRRNGQPNAISINWEAWSRIGQAEESRQRFHEQMANRFRIDRGRREEFLNWCELGGERYIVYEATFSQAKDWFLFGHRVKGKSVLPGTVFLEMIVEASKALYGNKAVELADINFIFPLFVEQGDSVKVLTILDRREPHHEFMIVSLHPDVEQARLHVTGKARLSPVQATVTLDLQDLETRCTGVVLDERVEDNDARWNCLNRAVLNGNMGLAEVRLPSDCQNEQEDYYLHPAMLDIAIGFLPLQFRETSAYVPVHYKKIVVFEPLASSVFSFARIRGTSTRESESLDLNVMLLDRSGRRLVDVEKLTMRRVSDETEMLSDRQRESRELTEFLRHVRRQNSNWLTPEEGIEAFARILASGLPRVITTKRKLASDDAELSSQENDTSQLRASALTRAPVNIAADLMKARPSLSSEYVSASNHMEKVLAGIWSQVLGIEEVGINDNFFDLGGDSMLSIQVSSLVNQEIGVEAPSGLLFEFPTIKKFAQFLEERLSETDTDATLAQVATAPSDVDGNYDHERILIDRLVGDIRRKLSED